MGLYSFLVDRKNTQLDMVPVPHRAQILSNQNNAVGNMNHHGEGKGSCRFSATPAVLLEDSNVKNPEGKPSTQAEKEG